jgi:DNA-binding MarR family transcriptional regulator
MVKTKIEVVRELGKAMAELRIQFRQCIQGNLKIYDVGLTYEMIEVMSLLWQKDGINQQVIADRTLRDKSSMTYLIDNLVKR